MSITRTYTPSTNESGIKYYKATIKGNTTVTSNLAIITVIGHITNRTESDVYDWETLRQMMIDGTATSELEDVWLNHQLRGCLNYKDFNKFGILLNYEASRGVSITYPYTVKTNWALNDNISKTDEQHLLANINALRSMSGMPSDTPQVPSTIKSYKDINTIERIIEIADKVIYNTFVGWDYSGNQYSMSHLT